MRHRWIVKAFKIALLITIFIAGFGQAVLQLWNVLMPQLFGLHPISFWQAVGLLSLSWILFGGFRGIGGFRGGRSYRRQWREQWRREMKDRWERMTPEQREKFQEGLQSRCRGRSESTGTAI
jgi:hypothetical protein